jgi:ankyrin repeat protein
MSDMVSDPSYNLTALYAAAYAADIDSIQKLAVLGVDPNICNPSTGYTALHVAVSRCHYNAVVALINEFRGKVFFTVVSYMIYCLLIRLTASCRQIVIATADHRGDTPLHIGMVSSNSIRSLRV